jgi:hypothetical protein
MQSGYLLLAASNGTRMGSACFCPIPLSIQLLSTSNGVLKSSISLCDAARTRYIDLEIYFQRTFQTLRNIISIENDIVHSQMMRLAPVSDRFSWRTVEQDMQNMSTCLRQTHCDEYCTLTSLPSPLMYCRILSKRRSLLVVSLRLDAENSRSNRQVIITIHPAYNCRAGFLYARHCLRSNVK